MIGMFILLIMMFMTQLILVTNTSIMLACFFQAGVLLSTENTRGIALEQSLSRGHKYIFCDENTRYTIPNAKGIKYTIPITNYANQNTNIDLGIAFFCQKFTLFAVVFTLGQKLLWHTKCTNLRNANVVKNIPVNQFFGMFMIPEENFSENLHFVLS